MSEKGGGDFDDSVYSMEMIYSSSHRDVPRDKGIQQTGAGERKIAKEPWDSWSCRLS